MLELKKKRFGIPFSRVWFAEKPSIVRSFMPVDYIQCRQPGLPLFGFVNRRICLRIVDLEQPEETILEDMKPRTRSQIRRARRDGVEIQICDNKDEFLSFYNGFADSKRGSVPVLDDKIEWGTETTALKAVHNGIPLVMNHYIIDRSASRARMLRSASHFRKSDTSLSRNMMGRANRMLHFEAMLRFKNMGIRIYDFGEYERDTRDENLAQVNRFKDSFGGTLEYSYKVSTLPMLILKNVDRFRRTSIFKSNWTAEPSRNGGLPPSHPRQT